MRMVSSPGNSWGKRMLTCSGDHLSSLSLVSMYDFSLTFLTVFGVFPRLDILSRAFRWAISALYLPMPLRGLPQISRDIELLCRFNSLAMSVIDLESLHHLTSIMLRSRNENGLPPLCFFFLCILE